MDGTTEITHAIEHAVHLLPAQGPITVFVHHNTLHAFEHLPFDEAVERGAELYGCHPYLREARYREELAKGRIQREDLSAAVLDDLGDRADEIVCFVGTRFHLRRAMLEHPLLVGTDAELRWLIDEADTLRRFSSHTPAIIKRRLIAETREWVAAVRTAAAGDPLSLAVEGLARQFGSAFDPSRDKAWEPITLHLLWWICRNGVRAVAPSQRAAAPFVRHRDALLRLTGEDADCLTHPILTRLCAAFLDQGMAQWRLPHRDMGLFKAFLRLYRTASPVDRWLRPLPRVLAEIEDAGLSPIESIAQSLDILGVGDADLEALVTQTLLALRGWAGMVWQMETNAEWTMHPAPAGSLVEYLAVRLILERLALSFICTEKLSDPVELRDLRSPATGDAAPVGQQGQQGQQGRLGRQAQPVEGEADQRAYRVFQLAQVCGWSLRDLYECTPEEWARLVGEIEGFSSRQRRRIFHQAYERHFRNQTLDAIAGHIRRTAQHPPDVASTSPSAASRPAFQAVYCIDEREESFRRHLEEVEPACETFGFAGFFGVAMFYRGETEAHFRPLCPVVVKPRHYVREEALFSFEESSRKQAETRRRIGQAARGLHLGTRTILGGLAAGLLGAVATVPLTMRILFPRATSRFMRSVGTIVRPPATQLRLERIEDEPGAANGQLGFAVEEMADVVGEVLRGIGLTTRFAPLVFMVGHGSSSLNNPHGAAYDCGACGGGCGGPNARAFAQMANDPRVRKLLRERGLSIHEDVRFVGCLHNSCDDGMTYYDLDRLPVRHRRAFVSARNVFHEARQRNAHERCRRFESAEDKRTHDAALSHVEARAEDLSQVRPECGHATNGICLVGRRAWSRGLFLDRRAFLTSYDPSQDDEDGAVLAGLLTAVVPVCAGINLEYYFSYVDSNGYGCGTKLPHNITCLLGVMNGAASDLRTGLPWQMVEIHEPVRILFVIEARPAALERIIQRNPAIRRLVRNEWVQIATLDAATGSIQIYHQGEFRPYRPSSDALPTAESSRAWYEGKRHHLGFASVVGGSATARCGGDVG